VPQQNNVLRADHYQNGIRKRRQRIYDDSTEIIVEETKTQRPIKNLFE
jgi:hypothetical protein